LSFDKIAAASDYALAEAAKPIFGQLGFTVISIAAMISTFSAINATLLGGSRVNFDVAKEREMPREFTHLFWGKPVGLAFISGAALILANTVDLESISTAGSAGFLVLFAMVNYTSGKLSHKISSNKVISILGMVLCFLAFAILVFQQLTENPIGIGIALGLFGLCFVGEIIYRKRGLKKEYPQE
jgi:amino acid transporter